ncbi:MAG: PAS domain-containing protein, partial [Deltaproteobacteria bacterium]|nr:PAS domain-containing protein [Deltaproteobacteria bacterium]
MSGDSTARLVDDATPAQLELRESQKRYEQLVASIDGIVWEADAATLRFSFVSQQAERLLGYPLKRWLEPDFWRDHIHPDDREWAVRYCIHATRAQRGHDFEYRMLAADDRVVWLRDIVTVVVENGETSKLRGIMVDVSERKKKEEALRAMEQRLRGIVENLSDVVYSCDLSGRFTYISPAIERVSRYTPEECIGRDLRTFIHPEDLPAVESSFAGTLAGHPASLEYRVIDKNGEIYWAQGSSRPLIENGEV